MQSTGYMLNDEHCQRCSPLSNFGRRSYSPRTNIVISSLITLTGFGRAFFCLKSAWMTSLFPLKTNCDR